MEGKRLPGRYALVLSGEHRSRDRRVSILMLSDNRGTFPDAVKVYVRGVPYYAHCGLVTVCHRYQLGKMVDRADAAAMARIDGKVPVELGLLPAERKDYERLYKDTVELLDDGKEGGKGDGF